MTVDVPAGRDLSGERRHLTVLFSDLVDSTELSQRLDPEDLAGVIGEYQQVVANAIVNRGGYVAKFMGDGVLAYFGWPRSFEDQADRAVRAALDAVAAVPGIAAPNCPQLQARVGVATGLVVVCDLKSEGPSDIDAVFGNTPNLAARLQGSAKPGQVVVEAETRRMIGDRFKLQQLDDLSLKGFSYRVPAWQVTPYPASAPSFFARGRGGIGGFFGRDAEVTLLHAHWKLAAQGRGQAVFIHGEAGIGKSRLVWEFSHSIPPESHARILYQCSAHYTHSTLHPAAQHLEGACGIRAKDSAVLRLKKLHEYVRETLGLEEAEIQTLGEVLGLTPAGCQTDPVTPQQRRARMIAALLATIAALARLRPVFMVVEDAHWLDPSTNELLGKVADRIETLPLLLLMTSRSERRLWSDTFDCTTIMLDRLERDQTERIVRNVVGVSLGQEAVVQIVDRADGVPLFVEELSKLLVETKGGLTSERSDMSIPATLHASLAARIDSLGEAKSVAQMASVIGRSFSYELLAAVSQLSEVGLRDQLDRMIQSGLIFEQLEPEGTSYAFKHALVQDVAYGMLLRSRRAAIHNRIASVLEDQLPNVSAHRPELIAHHYTEAGLPQRAIPFWHRAAELAGERSAVPEAIAHLERGLSLLSALPPSTERDRLELGLQRLLGPALISAKGFPSPEAQRALARARELCESLGDKDSLFAVLFNLWIGNNSRGEVARARELAHDLMQSAAEEDSGKRLQAHHCFWTSEFFSGNLSLCYEHTGIGEQLYDSTSHRSHKFLYGAHDPGVCAQMFRCISSSLIGFCDSADKHADSAVRLGESIGHPRSQAMALYFAAMAHYLQGHYDLAVARAEQAIKICEDSGIAATGTQILFDRASFDVGDRRAGSRLAGKIDMLRSSGSSVIWPFQLGLLAEAELRSGRIADAEGHVDEGLSYIGRTGERWVLSELLRIKGELVLARKGGDLEDAVKHLKHAIDTAQEQRARLWELRAVTVFAKVLLDQRKCHEAREALMATLNAFDAEQTTASLTEARSLLRQL